MPQLHDSKFGDGESNENCKPPLPYVVGFKFAATLHEPSPPFGIHYDTKYPDYPKAWKEMSQSELCISETFPAGLAHSHQKKEFSITQCIRTDEDCGAQLVIVNGTMVAKIFDPLYYSPVDECGFQQNVLLNAEGDYCRESAAYVALQKSPEAASLTPTFYGSWIIDIDTTVWRSGSHENRVRKVPLLLLEYVRGTTMSNIDAGAMSDHLRSAVLKEVLRADAVICGAGICHGDLSPRNVIVVQPVLSNLYSRSSRRKSTVKVKVIDFNMATVLRHTTRKNRLRQEVPPKLPNPMSRYGGHMMEFMSGWIPNERGADSEWLWQQFHNDENYRRVVWDVDLSSWIHPEDLVSSDEEDSGSESTTQ